MRHLKAFYVFHITAGASSYSEAAEKLHITHGAVSKQIKLLEAHLSQQLFCKQGRRMKLTQAGELLKNHTDMAFNALDMGVSKLQKSTDNYIEVSCEPTLTMRWLMPRISSFYQIADVNIKLTTAGGDASLPSSSIRSSMAIRRDDFAIPADYEIHQLVAEWVGPVFSPEYWNKTKNDLANLTLLHSKTRPNAWKNWLMDSKERVKDPLHLSGSNQSFDHFYFCIQAAMDGLGAAIGSYPLVADELKDGRLIAPFGFIPSDHNYILLHQKKELDAKEKQFQQWLKNTLSEYVPDS